ncbi:MAG: hypothetical protein ACK559_24395 [bacterium]
MIQVAICVGHASDAHDEWRVQRDLDEGAVPRGAALAGTICGRRTRRTADGAGGAT